MKTFHKSSAGLCKELFKLERTGRYDDAFSEVEAIWTDRTKLPDVKDFSPQIAAEVILRCGSLIGFLGHFKQLPNAQEKSKNLLTEARTRFLDIYDVEKIAECENYLALAYWRAGEYAEAENWLTEAFSHDIYHSHPVILHSIIIESMILLSSKKHSEVFEKLNNLELMFLKYADDFLKGSFYNNLGVALECLGRISEGLQKLEKAKGFYLKSGNKFQYAVAENNLSMLYKSQNNFLKAHESADNAVKIFKRINDRTREGFSLDTKAQIYIAEKKYSEALRTIEKAIKIIKLSENTSFITETYLTKTKTLIHLDDISGATFCLFEAVELAKIQTGEKAAEDLIKEYETALREKFDKNNESQTPTEVGYFSFPSTKTNTVGAEKLELVLPNSIARYTDIQAVQIRNTHLEFAGLEKDSFAVVAETEVKKGDLAAITDLETDTVICGFYDEDFGIVCLESENPDPLLFDLKNIEILGKIVGVGKPEKSSGNKIIVKPLLK